jgi:hypothetical protein
MAYLFIGIAVAFNLLILLWKIRKERILDAMIDGGFLIAVAVLFSGSYGALVVGTIASAIVSLYLLISPPKGFANEKIR